MAPPAAVLLIAADWEAADMDADMDAAIEEVAALGLLVFLIYFGRALPFGVRLEGGGRGQGRRGSRRASSREA